MKIEYTLSAHDDGYTIADWFSGRYETLAAAEAAATKDEADAILRAAYLGQDCDGVTVTWRIV